VHRIFTARANALLQDYSQLIRKTWNGIDWRRQEIRDGAFILALGVVAYACARLFSLGPKLFQFGIDNARWDIDDLIFVVFLMSLAFATYSYRRVKDLSREMEARRKAEMEAHKLARHDPLTGLPNRRFFVERLGEVLSKTTTTSRSAVLMLDLDGFKSINDTYGHAVGDRALTQFAERISAIMRVGAFLTRVGGDEFAIIVPDISSLDNPTALARRIEVAVTEPFLVDHIPTTLGVGIGIAIAPQDGMDPEVLVQHADRALYRAKAEGHSGIRFFEPDMNAHVERRIAMERELRAALAAKVIVPYYQPVVALDGNRVVGFEALARWKSDKFGWVGPDQFITIAEEIGLITELGDQLLRQACLDARTWPAEMTLAFNISAIQLRDPKLGTRILAILAETGFMPNRLELEITETALVDHIEVAQNVINRLRQAGVRIALDDFGTGYATLSQLLSFQLDRIKIDRSFVDRLGKSNDSAIIVRAILGLANGFGLAATAEGIEDAEQLATLKANGCQEGQGYLFEKAVPANEIPGVLEKINKLRIASPAKSGDDR
jgi:diguanylate cyclase (GGDEF)-like protein